MSNESFFDATLYIDLEAVKKNYLILKEKVKPATCAATVKANAYGLDVGKISEALFEAGCRDFFVATLGEAVFLRKTITNANIYVFHGLKKCETDAFYQYKLTPILNDYEQVYVWNEFAKEKKEKLRAIVHFDTGINRLGIVRAETTNVVKNQEKLFSDLEIVAIMSHLACSNEIDNVRNKNQLESFKKIAQKFPKTKYTLANSSAIYLGDEYHFDLVRPGAALFGIDPTPYSQENPMHNVVSLVSKIIHIKTIDENGMVGYGNMCPVAKGARLATIPVGYADGYLRSLTNRGYVYLKGKKVPTLGKISMDMTMIDISCFKEGEINLNDEVEIIGKNINLSNLSTQAGTIPYEILTSFSSRFKREFV